MAKWLLANFLTPRWYKTPDGKALNAFGHDEVALSRDKAYEVIDETHHHWNDLRASPVPELWTGPN